MPQESAPDRATGWDERRKVVALCLVLAAITFAVFGQTVTHEFVNFDDDLYVYDNPHVNHGLTLKGVGWAFTHVHTSNWHPLTWISHMVDCQLYGLHAGWHHLTNVLLHAVNVIALFLILRRLTGTLWRSAFAAAVFAIHPLRVESVAWVAERKDVLSGLFFLLTIAAYIRYARGPRSPGRYGLVALLFALGLLCKPMLVTLPLVLLLLDYWPLRRVESAGKLVLEKIPLLVLSAASCMATLFAQTEALESTHGLSFAGRVCNAVVSVTVYLGQMVWPIHLAVLYPYSQQGLPPWKVVLAALVLIGLSALAFWQRRQRPWLLMGWLWYLITLAPVIGVVQVGGQAHADRYTYLPGIGIAIAATWLLAGWAVKRRIGLVPCGAVAAIIVLTLAGCAWRQSGYWQDSITLWTHTLACTAGNDIAHHNLGAALLQKGQLDGAIAQYRLAVAVKPRYPRGHFTLAAALMEKGAVDEALLQFTDALQLDPKDAEFHTTFGRALLRKGKEKEAEAHFLRALQLKPDFARAHFDLANFLVTQGNKDYALAHFQKAVELDPDDAEFQAGLGTALLHKGQTDEAAAHFLAAVQIKPDYPQAQYDLANILLQNGRTDDAISHYQQAVQSDTNYALAYANLGAAFLQKGNNDEALQQFQRALQIDPSNTPAHVNLGNILMEQGQQAEAINQFRKALQLSGDQPDVENSVAWLLATAADASLRNGREAVQLAQRANASAGGRSPFVLRTLAAAFAQAGQFAEAKRTAQAAMDLAQAARQQQLAAQLSLELKQYELGRPLHP